MVDGEKDVIVKYDDDLLVSQYQALVQLTGIVDYFCAEIKRIVTTIAPHAQERHLLALVREWEEGK
jgi:hypothetical protein